ncbi:MAG TPA: hypothetical protein VMM37_06365 [Bacteroidota bacterium]|nr:hypothetical protein [Bacteroidota bacterium]
MVSPDVTVTTEVLWRGTIIFLLADAGFACLLVRRTPPSVFRKCRWILISTTVVFWGLLWTLMMRFFWESVYGYVFPVWSRWIVPPVYACCFGLVALFFSWLAFRLPGRPVLNYLLLGGLWGSVTHVWAIGRGILDKPPMLQGASPVAAVVLPFFEFIFYWCIITAVSAFLCNRFTPDVHVPPEDSHPNNL